MRKGPMDTMVTYEEKREEEKREPSQILQKERYKNEVRYQDRTEMTLDCG